MGTPELWAAKPAAPSVPPWKPLPSLLELSLLGVGRGGDMDDYGGRGISGAWKGVGSGEEALCPEPSSGLPYRPPQG